MIDLKQLRSADDMVTIDIGINYLKNMLKELQEATKQFRLRLNFKKTKILTMKDSDIVIGGREL